MQKKAKILILEIGGSHTENIHSIAYLLNQQQCDVFMVCNQSLWLLLPHKEAYSNYLLVSDKLTTINQLSVFWRIYIFILTHKIDTVIIGTTEITSIRNLSIFLPKKCNYTGIIHNAEKLEKGDTIKNIISKKVKKFLLLSNYLYKSTKPLPQYKVAALLPIYFPKPDPVVSLPKTDTDIFITIPGVVEDKRRDYVAFLSVLKKQPYQEKIKIVFLGKYNPATEITIANELDSLTDWKNNIILFDDYLDYNTFHSYILQTNFIFPLFKFENDTFYGDYRVSGSINLGLGYKIPFLLPTTYQQNEDSAPFSLFYDNYAQLFSILFDTQDQLSASVRQIHQRYESAYFNNIPLVSKQLYDFITSK